MQFSRSLSGRLPPPGSMRKFKSRREYLLAARGVGTESTRLSVTGQAGALPSIPTRTSSRLDLLAGSEHPMESTNKPNRMPRILPHQRQPTFRRRRQQRRRLIPLPAPTRPPVPKPPPAVVPTPEVVSKPTPTPAVPVVPPTPVVIRRPASPPIVVETVPDPPVLEEPAGLVRLPWHLIRYILLFLHEGDALACGVVDKKLNSVVQSQSFWALTVDRFRSEVVALQAHRDSIRDLVAAVCQTLDEWPSDEVLFRYLGFSALPPPLEYLLSAVGAVLDGLWKTHRKRRREARRKREEERKLAKQQAEAARVASMSDMERVLEIMRRGAGTGQVGTASGHPQKAHGTAAESGSNDPNTPSQSSTLPPDCDQPKLQAPQGRFRRRLYKHYTRDKLKTIDYADAPAEYMFLASKVLKRGEGHLKNATALEAEEWTPMMEPFCGMSRFIRALVKLFECGKCVAHLNVKSLTVAGVDRAIQLRHRKTPLAGTMVRNSL